MTELDKDIQLKLIEMAECQANSANKEMNFPTQEAETDFWINSFGDIYKKLVKAIIG